LFETQPTDLNRQGEMEAAAARREARKPKHAKKETEEDRAEQRAHSIAILYLYRRMRGRSA